MTIYVVLFLEWRGRWHETNLTETTYVTSFGGINNICTENTHVYYLKVPKTGSTTFSTILSRKAIRGNLTMLRLISPSVHPALLFESLNRSSKSRRFTNEHHRYEIQGAHAPFNEKKILKLMHTDTVFVASIRYPFDNFRSRYYFFQKTSRRYFKHPLPKELDPIEFILKKGYYDRENQFYTLPGVLKDLQSSMYKYFQQNHTAAITSEEYFQESLKYLEKRFPIVLINEYYDQSLVLFKRFLCWTMKDILYISHKNASYSKAKKPEVYGKLFQMHKNISVIDYRLYSYFLEIHKRNLAAAGPSIIEEIEVFQLMNTRMNLFCNQFYKLSVSSVGRKLLKQQIVFEKTAFSDCFNITAEDCLLMFLPESKLTKVVTAMNYPYCCEHICPQVNIFHSYCQNQSQCVKCIS